MAAGAFERCRPRTPTDKRSFFPFERQGLNDTMRPGQQNNKNRSRGRGNNNGGRKHMNPLSRSYESNGPDVKIRGNAAHIAEKYQQLARDAHASGDSVMAENYLQHAEHYFRILSAAQPQGMPRPDQFGNEPDLDEDEADEFGLAEPAEINGQGRDDSQQAQGNGRARREPQPRRDENQPFLDRPAFVSEIADEQQPAAETAQADQPGQAGQAAEPQEAAAAEPKRPRRPRRRRTPVGEQPTEATDAQQPEVSPLPAFLTAGGTAAE
jgi:hypothetical protein